MIDDLESIICEEGEYVNGIAIRQTRLVNCTTRYQRRHPVQPACQTKVRERVTRDGSYETRVLKQCKTDRSCNMHARHFQERDCLGLEGRKV